MRTIPLKKHILAASALAAIAATALAGPIESEVESISRARYEALNKKDVAALDKLYAKDYQFVSFWGKRYGVGFLKSWMQSGAAFKLTPANYKIAVSADGTMAFAVLDLHEEYGAGKEASVSDTVFTEIYEKKDGRWMLVQGHNSVKGKAPWEK